MALSPTHHCIAGLRKSPSIANWIRESGVTRRVAQFNSLSRSFHALHPRRSSCSDAPSGGAREACEACEAWEALGGSRDDLSLWSLRSVRNLSLSETPAEESSGSSEEQVDLPSESPSNKGASRARWRSIRKRLESLSLKGFRKSSRSPQLRATARRVPFFARVDNIEEIEECESRSPTVQTDDSVLQVPKRMPRHSSPLPKENKSKMSKCESFGEQSLSSLATSPAMDVYLSEPKTPDMDVSSALNSLPSSKNGNGHFSDCMKSPESKFLCKDKSPPISQNIAHQETVPAIFQLESSVDIEHEHEATSHSTIRESSPSVSCVTLPTLDSVSEIKVDDASITADDFSSSCLNNSETCLSTQSTEKRPMVENDLSRPGKIVTFNPHYHPTFENNYQQNKSAYLDDRNSETKSEVVSFKNVSLTQCASKKVRWSTLGTIKVFNPQHHPALKKNIN